MRIGINGFGRIGRLALRSLLQRRPDLEVAAINDRGAPEINAYMFKYDSTYGTYPGQIEAQGNYLLIEGRKIYMLSHLNPLEIPWADLGVELVIEATGVFRDADKAAAHLEAGARRVLITAPSKGVPVTVVMGVNQDAYDPTVHQIVSAASCTTNCLAPVAKVLLNTFGIQHGVMSTIHSYTNDQRILDKSHPDPRRARAAAANIIPTTTGATRALGEVIPALANKFRGISYRVPTITVSVVDLVVELEHPATEEEVNSAFRRAASGYLNGILTLTHEPVVSSDLKGMHYSAIVDGLSTVVVPDSKMVRVVAWYDNEWGYASRVVDLAHYMIEHEVEQVPSPGPWHVTEEEIAQRLVVAEFES